MIVGMNRHFARRLADLLAAAPGEGIAAHLAAVGGAVRRWAAPPAMRIDPDRAYAAVLETNFGDIAVALLARRAPRTVNNFVFLARQGFYDGHRFFRIIRSFMVQTGDPNNNGTGGPGYSFADELPPALPYGPGVVAMANAGPDTNGSQFFICTDGPHAAALNRTPAYTVFGRVTAGMDVLAAIAAIPVVPSPGFGGEVSRPTRDAFLRTVRIQED
jgi:cyclophilin family peptidyl-prolyl cis-trans isomerase